MTSAGAPSTAGGSATAGGAGGSAVSGSGTAKVEITSFSLTGCSQSVSVADLAAKNDGLKIPKPTQTFAAGTFTVDYAASGQYGQVGIDLTTPTDLTDCTISATLQASSSPACGVYAVPFFFDATLGTVAPFDASAGLFVGEQISSLPGPATINFKATGAALTKVSRVGINVYDCASSVTVGDLSFAK